MISASVAGAHRFGRVKRNGYDPVEVDAVMSRLVESLRTYESKTAALEERLAEADASADAIRRTFLAAEATREEIIEAANSEADTITDAARREADEILQSARTSAADLIASAESDAAAMAELADRLDHEIAQRRDEILTKAHEDAEAVVTDAEWAAAQQKLAAVEEANAVVEAAASDAEDLRSQALMSHGYATIAATRLTAEAEARAEAIIEEARSVAAGEMEAAARDSAAVKNKAEALRIAAADLQRSAGELAELTSGEAAVLDLGQIEAMDAPLDQHRTPEEDALPPIAETPIVRDEDEAETIDLTEVENLADEEIEQVEDRPMLSLADPAEIDEDEIGPDGEPVEPRTYYQRSTGIPLSERIKIARKSG